MSSAQTFLVPTDFSEPAAAAVEAAVALAAQIGASILLLHVWEPPPVTPDVLGAVALFDNEPQRLALDGIAAKLNARGVHARACFEVGLPSERIVAAALRDRCSLIVIGTHGRTGVRRLLIGSVAEQVVRHAACPVLTVRSPVAPAERPAASA